MDEIMNDKPADAPIWDLNEDLVLFTAKTMAQAHVRCEDADPAGYLDTARTFVAGVAAVSAYEPAQAGIPVGQDPGDPDIYPPAAPTVDGASPAYEASILSAEDLNPGAQSVEDHPADNEHVESGAEPFPVSAPETKTEG